MHFSLSTLPLPLLCLLPHLTSSVMITQTYTSTITSGPTATSTLIAPASSTPPSNQYTSDPLFQSTILNSTNTYRTQHNATSLTWNTTLATYALTWAQHCNWAHSHGPNGENLAENYQNVTAAIDGWGDERNKYDFGGGGGFSEGTGHFSQLVWKATTSVGCARVDCDGNDKGGNARGWFVVCEYWPAGNVMGQFKEEVQGRVEKIREDGKGKVEEYVKYIHDKMNGAERRGGSWGAVLGLGVMVVMGLLL